MAENVHTYDSAGGRDFSVANAWVAHTNYDMATANNNEFLECYRGAHDDYFLMNLNVNQTAPAWHRHVNPAFGEGNPDNKPGLPAIDGSTVAFVSTTDADVLFCQDRWSEAQDLIGKLTINSGTNRNVFAPMLFTAFKKMMAIDSANAGTGVVRGFNPDFTNSVMSNCLAVNMDGDGFRHADTFGLFMDYFNCSAINNGGIGFHVVAANREVDFQLCLSDNNTGGDYVKTAGPSTVNYDHCFSSDGTGTVGHINQTFNYRDAGSNDFHYGADFTDGTRAGQGSPAIFDDIDGTVRPGGSLNDAGFDQFAPISGGKELGSIEFNETNIILRRSVDSFFDDEAFNKITTIALAQFFPIVTKGHFTTPLVTNTQRMKAFLSKGLFTEGRSAFNRGWITIDYIE